MTLVQTFLIVNICGPVHAQINNKEQTNSDYLAPQVILNHDTIRNAFIDIVENGNIFDGLFESENQFSEGAGNDGKVHHQSTNIFNNFSSPVSIPSDFANGKIIRLDSPTAPPPPENFKQVFPTGFNEFKFGLWGRLSWNKEDLVQHMKKYGIIVDSEDFDKEQLRRVYNTFVVAVEKDKDFTNAWFMLGEIHISREDMYFQAGEEKPHKLLFPHVTEYETKIIFYNSFFYINRMTRIHLFDGRSVNDRKKNLIDTVKMAHDLSVYYEGRGLPVKTTDLESAQAQDMFEKLDIVGTESTIKFILDSMKDEPYDDIKIAVPELISIQAFKNALRISRISYEELGREQMIELLTKINELAQEDMLNKSRVDDELLNRAISECSNVSLSAGKKKMLIKSLNSAIDTWKNEKKYWGVREHFSGGRQIRTFLLYPFGIQELDRLRNESNGYKNPRVWKIREDEDSMAMYELLWRYSPKNHEIEEGHLQQVFAADPDNPVLDIPLKDGSPDDILRSIVEIAVTDWKQKAAGLSGGFVSAMKGITNTLGQNGYNAYLPGPKTEGLLKEVHANVPIFRHGGYMAVALDIWFFYVFSARENLNVNKLNHIVEHICRTRYTFLNERGRNLVRTHIQEIDNKHRKERKLRTRNLKLKEEDDHWVNNGSGTLFPKLLNVMMGIPFFAVETMIPTTLKASTIVQQSQGGAGGANLGAYLVGGIAVGFSVWIYNKFFSQKAIRKEIERLSLEAMEKNDVSKLRRYYDKSNYKRKQMIINTVGIAGEEATNEAFLQQLIASEGDDAYAKAVVDGVYEFLLLRTSDVLSGTIYEISDLSLQDSVLLEFLVEDDMDKKYDIVIEDEFAVADELVEVFGELQQEQADYALGNNEFHKGEFYRMVNENPVLKESLIDAGRKKGEVLQRFAINNWIAVQARKNKEDASIVVEKLLSPEARRKVEEIGDNSSDPDFRAEAELALMLDEKLTVGTSRSSVDSREKDSLIAVIEAAI
ncbi:MAG: hypothetical protein GY853_03725 [PVC group bacterium]|nr:hypothetical protein [PVC group bacterium]